MCRRGILFSYVSQDDEVMEGVAAVIDVGFYTLDATLYNRGRYIVEAARSYPFGVNVLIEKVKNEYSRVYRSFISDEIAERLIRSGKFVHMGVKYTLDVGKLRKDFIKSYVMRAISEFAATVKELGSEVNHLLLGGGGVHCLGEVSGAKVVEDPQMANAVGFCEFGKRLLGR